MTDMWDEMGRTMTLGPVAMALFLGSIVTYVVLLVGFETAETVRVLVLRKRYEPEPGLAVPELILSHQDAVPMTNHTGMEGRGFQFLLPYGDMRFDFEMNLMWFKPGVCFPAVETHVMEHGLYMLEGHGLYLLGEDWHEIWASDFIWMGAYCPQQFYPTGHGDACYLLYKNVNRDVAL